MRHIFRNLLFLFICSFLVQGGLHAEVFKGNPKKKSAAVQQKAGVGVERCRRAQGSAELSINNVRCRINTYGNMWYDGTTARYLVPKDGTSSPMYAAALWIAGNDVNQQLRVAALRFGSEGDDFWPGPLSADGAANVDKSVCDEWDKIFRITRAEVERFIAGFEYDALGNVIQVDESLATDAIRNWPWQGTKSYQTAHLAPFFDQDGDGRYDWSKGDYPYYDLDGKLCPRTKKALLKPGEAYVPDTTLEAMAGGTGNKQEVYGGLLVDQVLKGDETLWWVFNDKGNAHTESKSEYPIGIEIRAQAFAFTMNDEINNMTFYSYEIINRSTYTLQETFFSQWVDPDLGYAHDDYVGCDVERGLGYCYNGKAIDGPGTGAYSGNPPAVGIDFFQGPYMDPDGKDNPKIDTVKMLSAYPGELDKYRDSTGSVNMIMLTDDADKYKRAWYFRPDDPVGSCAINGVNFGNGIIDDERFGMRRFVFYDNKGGTVPTGEPDKASDYYNYLRGIWRDGTRMVFGGNGHRNHSEASNIHCDFMFPGKTDIWNWGTNGVDPQFTDPRGWTEETTSNNPPHDRRFMQSAGPFTLKPGAINYITVGIPFAQATSGGPYASVELLRQIDDKCQSLFDNCFNILEGPDAPEVVVQELDREIILYLTNERGNNINESYERIDFRIPRTYENTSGIPTDTMVYYNANGDSISQYSFPEGEYDRHYRFEGYQIFQLKDATVSIADIRDPNKARLVAQCDIENYFDREQTQPIGKLVNYEKDDQIGGLVPTVKVDGLNNGIQHSFRITEDQFAPKNDRRLVNHRQYHFVAIAYAHNTYKKYDPQNVLALDGQKEPYLPSRKGSRGQIQPVTAIPHSLESEQNGTLVQSSYGVSPEIKRLEGFGNGGIAIELKQESIDELMGKKGISSEKKFLKNPEYQINHGPLNIKIVDPLNVKAGTYTLKMVPSVANGAIDTCVWVLENADATKPVAVINDQEVYQITSPTTVSVNNEVIVFDLGISITFVNPPDVARKIETGLKSGNYFPFKKGGDVIPGSHLTSSVTFEDPLKVWLTGFEDNDANVMSNWILSGSQVEPLDKDEPFFSKISFNPQVPASLQPKDSIAYLTQDYYFIADHSVNPDGTVSNLPKKVAIDPKGEFERVGEGWWAPYRMVSKLGDHPGFSRHIYASPENTANIKDYRNLQSIASSFALATTGMIGSPDLEFNDLNNLGSVDIVFTNDQSKWTRCPVIEMGSDPFVTEGNARKFQLRKHPSVGKDGLPDGTGDGMGWFPGYAICLETGERLNIFFGEDSELGKYNGRDMLWNPSAVYQDDRSVIGGKHFIYVVGNNHIAYRSNVPNVKSTAYDQGKWAYDRLRILDRVQVEGSMMPLSQRRARIAQIDSVMHLFANVMWVGIPMATGAFDIKDPRNIPTDAKISIRMRKSYGKNFYNNRDGKEQENPAQNANYPMYQFTISKDLETRTNEKSVAEKALDQITVVPNPYFASSTYETYQVENLVKICNVPPECYITIYTVDGKVVRKLRGPSAALQSGGGVALTSVNWDLKNHNGLPISGGVYLIHVYAPNIGEKVVKWFGALRPMDLNSFQ